MNIGKLLEVFDFLYDIERLEVFLATLTEEERGKLYSHPLVGACDLLPLRGWWVKMSEKNWQRIKFLCKECETESWQEFDVNTYVLKVEDLICVDCYMKLHPEEDY